VLQGEQEYEMSVKLFDEVDCEKSRWDILSTKACSLLMHSTLQYLACNNCASQGLLIFTASSHPNTADRDPPAQGQTDGILAHPGGKQHDACRQLGTAN
jgi:hypothetical protein